MAGAGSVEDVSSGSSPAAGGLYSDTGELRCFDHLKTVQVSVERRSRKGSSCGSHSLSSESDLSGLSPGGGGHDSTLGVSVRSNATITNSPNNNNNPYQGIMSSLTTHQTIVFIKDHLEAVADTAAIDTLHQVAAVISHRSVRVCVFPLHIC